MRCFLLRALLGLEQAPKDLGVGGGDVQELLRLRSKKTPAWAAPLVVWGLVRLSCGFKGKLIGKPPFWEEKPKEDTAIYTCLPK